MSSIRWQVFSRIYSNSRKKSCDNYSFSDDGIYNSTNIQDKTNFYAQKQLLLSACLSHRNSVHLSVRHTGRSVKNVAS